MNKFKKHNKNQSEMFKEMTIDVSDSKSGKSKHYDLFIEVTKCNETMGVTHYYFEMEKPTKKKIINTLRNNTKPFESLPKVIKEEWMDILE